jgi:hypothetical protein
MPDLLHLEDLAGIENTFWLPAGGVSAYGGALRLFPSKAAGGLPSADEWNSPRGWLRAYENLAPSWRVIGEDAFGIQFLMSPDRDEVGCSGRRPVR